MFGYLAPPLAWNFHVPPPPSPATVPFLLPRGKTPGSMKVAMLKFASTNKKTSPLYTGMAGEMAFVNQGHLWRSRVMGKALTHGFFPLTTITQRSSLGHPSHAARLNITEYNRNFQGASFSDHCNTLCKAALFQSTESPDCSQGSQGFATLLPHLQPGVLLLCAAASAHCCNSFTFSAASLQLGLLSIFPGVKHNRIQTTDPQSRGKENHICFSLSFHGF